MAAPRVSGARAFNLIPDIKTVAVSTSRVLSQARVYIDDSLTSGHRLCFRVHLQLGLLVLKYMLADGCTLICSEGKDRYVKRESSLALTLLLTL